MVFRVRYEVLEMQEYASDVGENNGIDWKTVRRQEKIRNKAKIVSSKGKTKVMFAPFASLVLLAEQDKFEMYKVIIPFSLKQFYNETGGAILKLDTAVLFIGRNIICLN